MRKPFLAKPGLRGRMLQRKLVLRLAALFGAGVKAVIS
jgi:hypothetical protein